jgi:hypothetical protein
MCQLENDDFNVAQSDQDLLPGFQSCTTDYINELKGFENNDVMERSDLVHITQNPA